MKCYLSLLFLSCLLLPANAREKFNFNQNWKVHVGDLEGAETPAFDDSDWKDVTTPYAWNEDDAFRVSIANLSTGIAWYRKRFELPSTTKGDKIFLEFEGIRHAGEFYLNGKWIGRSENGVMAFGFDITDTVTHNSTNVLAARINNDWAYREIGTDTPYQWNDRNFYANYGGINKNVFLHVTDRVYQTLPLYSNLNTTGVYIYAQDINVPGKSATVTAEAEVRNEYKTPKTFTFQVEIGSWEGDLIHTIKGDSYTLGANETTVVSASADLSGLEFWSWGYGYMYNVRTSLIFDGKAIDTVSTTTGFRKTEFDHGRFRLNDRALHLKGYAQRTTNEWPAIGSAVPPWLSDFSNELVLTSNGNLIRWMHVTPWKQDVESLDRLGILQALPAGDSEADRDGRRWEMRVELMRDAIIYNRNNPSVVFYEAGNAEISEEHMAEMKQLRDTYDPHGGRAAGCREMLASEIAEYGGEMLYINKGARIPFWQMEYSRDEGLRKYWDNYSPPYHLNGDGPLYNGDDASSYNHNQDSHAIEDVERWFDYYEQRPGTGTRVNAGGVNIVFSDSNTHYRGAENYRRSGEVDAVRLPKDGWYAHRVMWDNWVDIERVSGHIIGHWNYNDTTVKDVYVVSTAEKVELSLNGNSLGWGKQTTRFLFTFFNVTWEAGELSAYGYSGDEKILLDEKKTSGAPAAIRLTPQTAPDGFVANGADIALVDVEVVDKDGQRAPIALNEIDFTLSGEATWRGGIAQGPDNHILSQTLPVENGVNRVLLRSTTKAGKVTLQAKSKGLKPASITLSTKPISVDHGLSTFIPGTDLQPNLSRGPTPEGESYVVTRHAVEVLNVTAGSAEANATASIDDDEETTWRSDSNQETAWIQYTWTEPVNVSQLVMKLRSFRSEQYSIVVSVDDTVVFQGTTPTSLGYVTLDLNATVGESLRIAMDEEDDLGIVEAEIYTPA
ncbi:putative cell-associated beta-galactosidase [Aspergillus mulundensis]|uniref:Beta-galactosidase n=1 Tax=Aspergillus mulundensis TaxID=1810919 RepID=A0A3D8RRF5_9EURO|nr:Beta-galactosidase [Aspergillus mulundensis]RDW76585.1 Beta-galactosidase [Aspergillus mulundensis]